MSKKIDPQITSHEKLATYNMLMAEAIFEPLVEKGFLTKEELLERIEKLRKVTKITIRNTH
jgi:hypothetical protein